MYHCMVNFPYLSNIYAGICRKKNRVPKNKPVTGNYYIFVPQTITHLPFVTKSDVLTALLQWSTYLNSFERPCLLTVTIITIVPVSPPLYSHEGLFPIIIVGAMVNTLFFFIPLIPLCFGEGNIHLMEEEIGKALQNCVQINNQMKHDNLKRQRRYDENNQPFPRIDANTKPEINQYNHERRNTSFETQVLNGSELDYSRYGYGSNGAFIKSVPQSANGNKNSNSDGHKRIKRNELLLSKDDSDKCLSQCVFANLQVLDSKGIPREGKLWTKIQSAITSQQSQALIKDQIRACFQELESESEDNGCSYSNKLERCLMLRFSDRILNSTQTYST